MKAKYITKDNLVVKETYDSFGSKFPFDSSTVYVGNGNYTAQNIRDMLEAAYASGARHALTEVRYKLEDITREFIS